MLIRADSSQDIGAGHVSRCAALADALYERGIRPCLLTRDLPGAVAETTSSLEVIPILGDHDVDGRAAQMAQNWFSASSAESWLIVDHYDLDERWERAAAGSASSVFVIDDLANRNHACRMLLDQNLASDSAERYKALVPSGCRLLLGPRYAMLRPEFGRMRETARVRAGTVKRVLVFFGGSDPEDLTTRTLRAIAKLSTGDVLFDVVVGAGNRRSETIRTAASLMREVRFHFQTTEMASLMAAADFSIGAGGTATWERCCLGLPSLVVVTAENQRRVVFESAASGACLSLGNASDLTASTIATALNDALTGRIDLAAMSTAALRITDGFGARRVAAALLSS